MVKCVDSCSVYVYYISIPTTNSKENAAMNVMKKAWEIAKEAVAKFGGKASEFFAEALRMAWAIKKGGVIKGSEKQIAYANDLLSAVREAWNGQFEEEYDRLNKKLEKRKAKGREVSIRLAQEAVDALVAANDFINGNHDNAADVIDACLALNAGYIAAGHLESVAKSFANK